MRQTLGRIIELRNESAWAHKALLPAELRIQTSVWKGAAPERSENRSVGKKIPCSRQSEYSVRRNQRGPGVVIEFVCQRRPCISAVCFIHWTADWLIKTANHSSAGKITLLQHDCGIMRMATQISQYRTVSLPLVFPSLMFLRYVFFFL